ncbi:MAG: YidC/Oxa1 family membrane protein insertase [Lachnospiraceae bacterium]|nr:YidC/Oxa1 family membrane protein insertase [Lachnospiraceae bacterium]
MSSILLTQNSTPVFSWICQLLGLLMEGIFYVLNLIGIPNVGLSIIIFTIVIYLCLMPLTVKQQKFSKFSAKMQPELKKVQDKYKGKRDNDSMLAMQEETKNIYAKYGVSPSGSCIQLLIQMPILFALYQVIYKMPAYVGSIKAAFFPLVDNLIAQAGSSEFIQKFTNANMYAKQFTNESFTSGVATYVQNTYVDVLNKASTADWLSIADKYPSLSQDVSNAMSKLSQYNTFLGGINIADSPWYIIQESFKAGAYGMLILALLYPLLAALTQWLNTKLMPQAASTGDATQDQMMQSMKTMNVMMPLMSAFFCFQLPVGLGIYWIAGAVIRSIQQIIINRHIDKMDLDAEIKKNIEKAAKKAKNKKSVTADKVNSYATMSTRSTTYADRAAARSNMSEAEREAAINAKKSAYENAKPNSIAAKANMVKQYNESNK